MNSIEKDYFLLKLNRELEMLTLSMDLMQKNCDRNNRLGLKDVSAFQSGMVYAYEYCSGVLVRLIDLLDGTEDSDDA